jgi:tetratricopeptide (TPR) repeat protein
VNRQRQDGEATLRDLEKAIQAKGTTPAELAGYHLEKGRILYGSKRYPEALEAADAALRVHAGNPAAYRLRAEAQMQLHRYPDALRAFDQYVQNKGKPDVSLYQQRGLARAELNRIDDAVDDFTLALAARPDVDTFTARGWVYVLSGAARLARHDFEQALKLNAAHGDAHNGLGFASVVLATDAKAVREAIGHTEKALSLEPKSAGALYKAARTYAQAVPRLRAQVAQEDRSLESQRARYLGQAVQLLRETLELIQPADRAAFWKQKVQEDRALEPLFRSQEFADLRARYAGR